MSAEGIEVTKSQEQKRLLKEKSLKQLGLYGEFLTAFIAPIKEKDLEALLKDEKFKKTLTPERRLQLAINIIDACVIMHSNNKFICNIGKKNILVDPDTLEVEIANMDKASRDNEAIAPEEYRDFKQSNELPEATEKADIYFITQCLLIPILAGKIFCKHYFIENGMIYYNSHPVTEGENKILSKTITESFNIRKKRLVPLLNKLRAEDPEERQSLENAKEELSTILNFVRQLEGTEKVKSNKSVFWITPDSLTDQTHHPDRPPALSGLTV